MPPSSSAGALKRKRIIIDNDEDDDDDYNKEEKEQEKDDIHQLAHPLGSNSLPIQSPPSHFSPKAETHKKMTTTSTGSVLTDTPSSASRVTAGMIVAEPIVLEPRAGSSALQALMYFHTQCLRKPPPGSSHFPLSCLKMLLHEQRLVIERLFLACMCVVVDVMARARAARSTPNSSKRSTAHFMRLINSKSSTHVSKTN